MAKARSPGYPAIGLGEAVDRVRLIWQEDYQNEISKEVVAKHMGYKGISGTSLTVIASLTKFGLLEGRGDNTRVSDLALTILAHEPGDKERVVALAEAAGKPQLFAELDARYQGGKTSDAALKSYLLTQKFIPDAADIIIRSYRLTKQLVQDESASYHAYSDSEKEEAMPELRSIERPPEHRKAHTTTYGRDEGDEPFRVSFGPKGMEVAGRIATAKDADDLIRAIEALKLLLRPADSVERYMDDEDRDPAD